MGKEAAGKCQDPLSRNPDPVAPATRAAPASRLFRGRLSLSFNLRQDPEILKLPLK